MGADNLTSTSRKFLVVPIILTRSLNGLAAAALTYILVALFWWYTRSGYAPPASVMRIQRSWFPHLIDGLSAEQRATRLIVERTEKLSKINNGTYPPPMRVLVAYKLPAWQLSHDTIHSVHTPPTTPALPTLHLSCFHFDKAS